MGTQAAATESKGPARGLESNRRIGMRQGRAGPLQNGAIRWTARRQELILAWVQFVGRRKKGGVRWLRGYT
jgi:hypothetical protein